jgi:hypothetical protein
VVISLVCFGRIWMEDEVNALMGATDEALWKRVGLFASVDVLCSGTTPSNKVLTGLALQTKKPSVLRGGHIGVHIPLQLTCRVFSTATREWMSSYLREFWMVWVSTVWSGG